MRVPPRFVPLEAKQMLNRVASKHMPFNWSLNPYRGCTHGCSFCYARSTHQFMGLAADDSFRSQIFVKQDAAEVLRRQLDRRLKHHRGDLQSLIDEIGWIAIGTATDPYQSVEAKLRVTRGCLEVLREYHIPVSITTRSPLILRDLDILRDMNLHSINISIHTLDKAVWRAFEPATPSPMSRLRLVSALRDDGLSATVFVAPILPFITEASEHLEEVLRQAQEHGAQSVMLSVLRLAPEIKPWFMAAIRRDFPELVARYTQLYQTAYAPRQYVDMVMRRAQPHLHRYGFDPKPHRPSDGELRSKSRMDSGHLPNDAQAKQLERIRPTQLTLPI